MIFRERKTGVENVPEGPNELKLSDRHRRDKTKLAEKTGTPVPVRWERVVRCQGRPCENTGRCGSDLSIIVLVRGL